MSSPEPWFVVGLDNGGNQNNATVLDAAGRFLVDGMVETPSRVLEGPVVAVEALAQSFDGILQRTGIRRDQVRVVGLDTPGPASALGVISSKGSTNFAHEGWRGYDFRGALETRLGLPVVYNNDGNAAALYAHFACYGPDAANHSSVSAIVGTGLGGGVVEAGRIVKGAAGMAGELGHVHIPMDGLLEEGQPIPECNCGFRADAESVASLTGIEKNLLSLCHIVTSFSPCRASSAGSSASGESCCSTSRNAQRRPSPSTRGHGSVRAPGPASWRRSPPAATSYSGIRMDTCS